MEEIRQIVEKVGTNRIIANKKVAWNWQPPYDFLASFLASRASGRGEPKDISYAENLTFPILCIYTTPLELILSKIPDFGKYRACGAVGLTNAAGALRLTAGKQKEKISIPFKKF